MHLMLTKYILFKPVTSCAERSYLCTPTLKSDYNNIKKFLGFDTENTPP